MDDLAATTDWTMKGTPGLAIEKPISTDCTEVGAYACALHPEATSYAWSGRSSKVVIRSLSPVDDSANGYGAADEEGAPAQIGAGPLSGESTVVEAGKGKFGMALKYVS